MPERTTGSRLRPCIVAGPNAQTVLDEIPYVRLGEKMPPPVVSLLRGLPALKPVIPDPGTRFQLVHEDDVASAFVAGVRGKGGPGPYNLAGEGTIYVTTGGGGKTLQGLSPPAPWTAYAELAYHFTRVAVDGDTLRLEVVRADGSVGDTLTVEKRAEPAQEAGHAHREADG